MRQRVTDGRRAQAERWERLRADGVVAGDPATSTNATLPFKALKKACGLTRRQQSVARREAARLGLSGRGWHRVLRVARSLADLERRPSLSDADLAEAFQYRRNTYELATSAGRVTLT